MPEITLRHEFDCDVDTFFKDTLFSDEHNRRLYIETLKFPGYKLLDSKDEPDRIVRKVHIDPPVTGLPGPVKKAIGDKFSYVEEGTFDKKTKRYSFKITPSTLTEKTKTHGELWCESLGDKKCARIAKISVEVKVFMIGGMVEEKILGDLKSSYDAAAKFTNAYLKEKGL